ncbi:MAG: gliding motility-associated C-terminal domain-containing protein, partial [Sphingobacteriales bacterium]
NTISAKTYGDAAFTLGSATTSGGLTVSYAADDPSVISIDGNKATILKAGTTKVTATQAGNNEYTAAVAVEQTLVVNKKAITASAQVLSKTYDGTAKANVTFNTLTATNGLVGTDDVSVIYTTASYNNKNVGTDKAVAFDGLTLSGSAKDNYSLNNFGITGAITKKSINVTAQADSRVYDGTAKSGISPVTDALETGDNIVTSAAQTFDNKNAGTGKTLTASGLTINDGNIGGNYDVKYIANTNGTITAKSINVTAQADSRTYNGAISSGVSPAVDALAIGDNVSTAPIQKFDNKNIGSGKTLTASGLTLNDGNSGNNYIVNYVANTNGVITAKSINVTAQADSRTYNGTNSSAVAPVVDALANGDNIATAPIQTFNNKNVGSGKTLTASGLVLNDGNSGNNYSLNYVASTGGSITAKSINVTAQADSRTYNGTNASALAPVVDALATGDNIATAAIQKFDNKNVGSGKTLTASGLILNDGNNGNNYAVNYLANTSGVITVKSIHVTAQADSRTYDGTTISSILPKVDALETGDLITQQPKQSFDNKNVGSGKTLTASGLSLNDGNSGNNYAVNYVSQPAGEITPARLTYIANAAAKVYGNDNPVLSGTITGFISGDNQSNATSGTLSFTTTASNQSGVGKYPITGGGLSAGNYLFAQATENTTAFSISKAPLTITANPAVRCYGINNPAFTVSYGGFKNSDNAGSLSQQPTVSTAANANSPAGVYELIVNGAEAANYTFSYTNGLFTINPLPVITITSDKGEVLSKGESTILTATGGNTYEWITASGIISGENTAQLTVRPFETTEYRVRVTTAEGCIAEAMYTVQIKDDFKAVEAENFVTPNGDGVNDSWVVKNIDAYPSHTLTIVDRAGRIIYKTRDYQNNWEATLDGAPVTQGTYYYIFQFDKPGIAPLKGFITVVK